MHVSTSRLEDNCVPANVECEELTVQQNQQASSGASFENPGNSENEDPNNETMAVVNDLDQEPCISIEAENFQDYETNATTDTNTNGLGDNALIVSDQTNGPPSNATEEANESELLDNDITEEDIEIFRQNQNLEEAISLSQEGESQHVPTIDMKFKSDDDAYKFYNQYALIAGFSIVKCGNYHSRDK